MKERDRKRLAGELLGIAKQSQPLGLEQLPLEFDDYGLDSEGVTKLRDLRDWLLRELSWGTRYSETFLTKLLQSSIGALRVTLDYKDATQAAEKLAQDWLAFKHVQHVYLPLVNITMTLTELQIGRAVIRRMTPSIRASLEKRIRSSVASTSKSENDVDEFVADQLARLDLLGSVVSVVEVSAEQLRAQEIARDETRRALDYLNYAASAIWGTSLKRAAGMGGDGFPGTRSVVVVKSNFTHHSSSHDFTGGIAAITLNGVTKKELKRLNHTKISKLLASSAPTDLEEAVTQALHWYSDSWVQSSLENELLGLVTALETFFTVRGQRIGTPLAEGVALVLTTGLANRKRMVQRIKHLYGLRGEITHGKRQRILPAEVVELRFYVLNLINTMITNPLNFDSREALRDWIEDQRLS